MVQSSPKSDRDLYRINICLQHNKETISNAKNSRTMYYVARFPHQIAFFDGTLHSHLQIKVELQELSLERTARGKCKVLITRLITLISLLFFPRSSSYKTATTSHQYCYSSMHPALVCSTSALY